MNKNLTAFVKEQERINEKIDLFDRVKVMAVAAAMHVAYCAPIPSSPVDAMEHYYRNQVMPTIGRELAEINEATVFDMGTAIEAAAAVWKVRYNAVHGQPDFMQSKDCSTIFEALFGVDRFIAADVYALANKYCNQTMALFNALREYCCAPEQKEKSTTELVSDNAAVAAY